MILDFLPKQQAFLEDVSLEKIFSGGYGSGKSTVVCTQILLLALRYPNNRVFLGRKFLQALKSTTLKTFLQGDGDFPPILPENLIKNHNKTDRVISLINNSEIIYGNVDIEQIKSLNLGGVAIDECGELSQEEWDALSGRLRLSGIPYRPIFGATNPYPESHWIWNRFMVNQPKNDKGESTVHLFQSATYENFHLPQTYIDNLKRTLFGHYYLRYVDGLWVGADKLVFDNYDPKLHIIPAERCFEIPKTWKRYRAVDFGYRSPFSCGWFTIVPEDDSDLGLKKGDVILYREIYMTQRTSGINAQQVKNASVYSDETPEIIQWTVCDWDAGDKADLEAVGIKTINATKTDKPFRIQKVRARLGNNDPSKGSIIKPRFFIFENSLVELDRKIRFNMDTGQTNNDPTCAKEEFLTYSWKPLKNSGGNEEPEDKFDHAMDMINYFINKLDSGGGWKDIEFKKDMNIWKLILDIIQHPNFATILAIVLTPTFVWLFQKNRNKIEIKKTESENKKLEVETQSIYLENTEKSIKIIQDLIEQVDILKSKISVLEECILERKILIERLDKLDHYTKVFSEAFDYLACAVYENHPELVKNAYNMFETELPHIEKLIKLKEMKNDS